MTATLSSRAPEPWPSAGKHLFTFIDLFSGIGGLRIGLESAGGSCVFSCEIDPHARKTYEAWFGDEPAKDIMDYVSGIDVPRHDVLAAGFPCQPFSIAGVSKKNSLGRAHGFEDKAQGTLFFHLTSIIKNCEPPVLFLENVKNLKSHNKGDTWRTISDRLQELGYTLFSQVIDAKYWVPQHRERIFIIGFRKDIFGDSPPFAFPALPLTSPRLADILQSEDDVDPRYILTNGLWQYLQAYARKHQARGNGFGFGMADRNGITRTLSARYYKDGSEILIPRGPRRRPRRLTIREAGRLMGFPEHFLDQIVVSDTQAYRQFGNAVVPKVAAAIADEVVAIMRWQLLRQNEGCLLAKRG
ncbi:MAG: DNA (cytosine-5-)-methyltransferase [Planctomycetota bacterium]